MTGLFGTPPKLHHVGLVFSDMAAADDYIERFGHAEDYRGFVAPFQCWCIFLAAPPGLPTVELVVPEDGPLARFNKGAGGLHHHAYEIDDIRRTQALLAERDMRMVEPEPVKGAGDFWCNFLHPTATRGLIVELVEMF